MKIYIFKLVDITKLPCYPHRRSTTVSLETFTLYSNWTKPDKTKPDRTNAYFTTDNCYKTKKIELVGVAKHVPLLTVGNASIVWTRPGSADQTKRRRKCVQRICKK